MTVEPTQTEKLAAPFQALRRGLLAYLYQRVSDQTVAEDLLQEVFLKALAARKSNTAPKNVTGWLYAIAKNTVVDFYRAKRPTEPVPDDLAADKPSDDLVQQELSACLLPLTRQLPDIYRDTLIATDFEGRTMKSVASEWKLSVSAIKSRASRAREMLKQKLLECCHVELSVSGAVTDYQVRSASKCGDGRGCA